jgi:hypothetical protein
MYFLNKNDSLERICSFLALQVTSEDNAIDLIAKIFTHSRDLAINHSNTRSLTYRIQEKINGFDEAILFVTRTGIFTNSENRHLYYRVRESYKNYQPIYDQPGHVFHNYEHEDLSTFIQIITMNYWDAVLVTYPSYYVFEFSHDSILIARSNDESIMHLSI